VTSTTQGTTHGATPGAPEETVRIDKAARAAQRSRKRFARRQWRRRWLAWRYLLAIVVAVAVVAGTIWAVWFSSWLAVKSVDVEGVDAAASAQELTPLTADAVRKAAAAPMGTPLVRVDLGAIRSRVLALAAVRSVDVTREWPDKILVRVTEREPVAVVQMGGKLQALDADGVVFGSYAKAPAGMPLVQTPSGTSATALSEAAKVAAALPASVASRVDHVSVATVDEISLVLDGGRSVVWGSAADSDVKAQVLAALLKARPHATAYDVSVPGQPVTTG
jgi:cell division protein FtsQ